MYIFKKFGMILIAVLLFSMIGSSVVAAKTEGTSSRLDRSVLSISSQETNRQADYVGQGSSLFAAEIECSSEIVCTSRWTGRWVITYHRECEGHCVTWCQLYVPDTIKNEQDAQNWRWSDEYIADNCSLADEPQTWKGVYLHLEKETIRKCRHVTICPEIKREDVR
ncbi:MAG: hypothetical protein HQ574_02620 [Chloroflexi bacterium]|nr:hypothetical protein [Chloroflexota bacterium]